MLEYCVCISEILPKTNHSLGRVSVYLDTAEFDKFYSRMVFPKDRNLMGLSAKYSALLFVEVGKGRIKHWVRKTWIISFLGFMKALLVGRQWVKEG